MPHEGPSCLWCDVEGRSERRLASGGPRECPACDHVFRGSGWDGFDAHWKAKHEPALDRYADVWAGILNCKNHYR
jgi:hypothetical protein